MLYSISDFALSWKSRIINSLGLAFFVALATCNASAAAINLDTWYQFGFTTAGTPATGCAPADPAGSFCTPSSGTPTTFVGAPDWTFVAPAGGATITIVDAFTTVESFELLDGLTSLGFTSVPNPNGDCGDDPVVCLADSAASKGTFAVGAGAHSLNIIPNLSPDELGAAYFIVQANEAVPEPSTLLFTAGGAAIILIRTAARRRRKV
jgi:hypothetical protein